MYAVDQLVGRPPFLRALQRLLRASANDSAPLPAGHPDSPQPGVPPLVGPQDAKLKLTWRCNLRCGMCRHWLRDRGPDLPSAVWRRTLDELAALGCRKVHFTGGEVFLRPDLLDLVEHAAGLGLKVNLTTNGTLIDSAAARRLVQARVNSVAVSLDGPSAPLHDRLRGVQGAFEATLRGVGTLQQAAAGARRPPKLRINFVLLRENLETLPQMLRLAHALGAVDLNALTVHEQGPGSRRLSREDIERYNGSLAPQVRRLRQELGFPTAPHALHPFGRSPRALEHTVAGRYARGLYAKRPCLAPWLHLFVAFDGTLYPCCVSSGQGRPLGRVDQAPLQELYCGSRYEALRREFVALRPLPACSGCDLFLDENRRLHAALRAQARRAPGP